MREFGVEMVGVDLLAPHPESARVPPMRKAEFEALVHDVRERGVLVPLEVLTVPEEGGETNYVLDGCNRLRAAREVGLLAVPVRDAPIGDLDPVLYILRSASLRRHLSDDQRAVLAEQERQYLADQSNQARAKAAGSVGGRGRSRPEDSSAANAAAELSEVEVRDRSQEVRERVAGGHNISSWKVRQAQRVAAASPELAEQVRTGEKRLAEAVREVERAAKARALEEAAEANRGGGQAGEWELQATDCIEGLAQLGEGEVRLIFADPPYNESIDYGFGKEADSLSERDYLHWTEQWMEACVRVLSDDGAMWVLISEDWADDFGYLLRTKGLRRRRWVVWRETFGAYSSNNFGRCARHLFYYVKDQDKFVFHADAVRVESARLAEYEDPRADPAGKVMSNVWTISRVMGNHSERLPGFPTQLPLDLLRPIVAACSDPGDWVLDPFTGSGTTGVAALELGRRFVGFERNPRFVEWARRRLSLVGLTGTQSTFE
jgi:site-specific DNA-methyltransferase (adenine-specific)